MKRRLITGLALAAATTVAGIVHAETPAPEGKPQGRPGIEKIDVDKDGKVTREEFEAAARGRAERAFAKLDANGDGSVSQEEFLANGPERQAKAFDRFDRNDDGVLTEDDRPERPRKGGGSGGDAPPPPPAN
ncbi:hypothetical protein GOB57_21110 [Sinorhizobium meliloti]|nr:hypothetical protein [Sinorhizobium meliloti]